MSTSRKPGLQYLFNKVAAIWEWMKDLGAILMPCRFSLIMLLVGLAFLILAPQGQDVLRALAEAKSGFLAFYIPLLLFFVAMVIWALNAWYWARVMLRFRFDESQVLPPERHARRNLFRKHVARILGLAAFLVVAAAFSIAAKPYSTTNGDSIVHATLNWLALTCVILAVVFYLFTAVRRKAARALQAKLANTGIGRHAGDESTVVSPRIETGIEAYSAHYRSLREIEPVTWLVLGLSMSLSVVLFLLFLAWPSSAAFFGAATIVLLAAAVWIPFGSAVVYFGSTYKFPVITVALISVLIFSFWNDNHEIRTLTGKEGQSGFVSQSVGDHFSHWIEAGLKDWPSEQSYPVFLVAAEGGGIRAAYWAGIVLAALQDRDPEFAKHVYAISGVSGGSLGGGVFAALVREQMDGGSVDCEVELAGPVVGPMGRCAHAILSADFLAPTVAYMLYPDLVQRFLPFPVPFFDRARALESAWEASWKGQFDSTRFSDDFHGLWRPQGSRVPALFLNSTWVETGKRVIVSNLKIDGVNFSDSVDFFDLMKSEVALSSAVHNSARFTYVSPAGTVRPKHEEVWGHLVDGGYFENSGATTAYEILRALQNKADELGLRKRITPVVLMITNDPKLDDSAQPEPRPFMNELLSPLVALLNTRDARGSYARAALRDFVKQQNGVFLQIGLKKGDGPLPLGWVLSDVAQQTMQKQVAGILDKLKAPLELDHLRRAAAAP